MSRPNAHEFFSRITRDGVSNVGLRLRDIRQTFVDNVPVILTWLSFSSEPGYEINVEPKYQLKLYKSIPASVMSNDEAILINNEFVGHETSGAMPNMCRYRWRLVMCQPISPPTAPPFRWR